MKIRTDTIPDRFANLRNALEQRQRRERMLERAGLAALFLSGLAVGVLFVGLGDHAAIIAQIGGGL
jgi:hypothetical protein